MKTSELSKKDVASVPASATLESVSKLMRKSHVGSVVVTGEGNSKPVGIVTDRDIVLEVVAQGLDPAKLTAGDVMTTSPVLARPDDDVLWTLKTMRDRGVRRMPVVDAKGDLAGIIAFDDVMQHVGTTLADIAQLIGTERVVESWRRN
jgi:CBS domain-containing protein